MNLFASTFALTAILTSAIFAAGDDRESITPAGWKVRTNQSVTDIQAWSAQGYRPIDAEVESASPLRMTMTYVKNSGSYLKSWSMIVDKTAAQVAAAISSSKRLLNLTPYVSSGSAKFCAIFVGNTGTEKKSWYWWPGSSLAYIQGRATILGVRLTDIDSYVVGKTRYYCGIGIKNTGSDARQWRLYSDQTSSQVSTKLGQTGMRVYDIERRSVGRYDVILVKSTVSTSSWWYLNRTMSRLDALSKQNGARIFDVERFTINGTPYYLALMIQTTNALTTKVGRQLRQSTDGSSGFVLQRLKGTTYASLQRNFVFDPASTIKQLHGAYAYWKARTDANVTTKSPISFRNGPCPYTTGTVSSEKLEDLVQLVLFNSDNRRTDAIEKKWGKTKFHSFADNVVGMKSTRSNRVMGCTAPPFNSMTLSDIVTLHEKIATGLLGNLREDFLSRMRKTRSGFPAVGVSYLSTLMSNERIKAGLTGGEYASFLSRFRVVYKPGLKTISSKFYRTTSGWVQIPFVINNAVHNQQFAYGAFVHGATNSANASNAVSTAVHELLRDRIAAAMATWKGFQFGNFTKFGTACMVGARTPKHEGSGIPRVGQTANFELYGGPSFKPALMWVGASRTSWNGSLLPISLIAIGAPGCRLYVAPHVSVGASTNFQGQATIKVPLLVSKSFVGVKFYTQFAMLAPTQNTAGFVTSNALETLVGGTK
jgi:Beta-lactamase enzyme family